MSANELMSGSPGEALVREGLADVQNGRRSVPAYLVKIARHRLVMAGLMPDAVRELDERSLSFTACFAARAATRTHVTIL